MYGPDFIERFTSRTELSRFAMKINSRELYNRFVMDKADLASVQIKMNSCDTNLDKIFVSYCVILLLDLSLLEKVILQNSKQFLDLSRILKIKGQFLGFKCARHTEI